MLKGTESLKSAEILKTRLSLHTHAHPASPPPTFYVPLSPFKNCASRICVNLR